MTTRFNAVIPILRIFSVEKAKDFYLGFLGFALDWEHGRPEETPLYLRVSRGGLRLHLSEHHGDGCPGAVIFVRMTGLEVFHAEISARPYRYLRPGIEPAAWGGLVMNVTDPFGNRLRFSEDGTAS